LIDGLNSTAFLQSIPVPVTLSGSSANHIIKGENTSTTDSAVGVLGLASGANGITKGVHGRSDSLSGIGVWGFASSVNGFTYGGQFESIATPEPASSASPTHRAGSQPAYMVAVSARRASAFMDKSRRNWLNDRRPWSQLQHVGNRRLRRRRCCHGVNYGGMFESASSSGHAIHAFAFSATGNTFGGWFQNEKHWRNGSSWHDYFAIGINLRRVFHQC
jgi:hypothetical protein